MADSSINGSVCTPSNLPRTYKAQCGRYLYYLRTFKNIGQLERLDMICKWLLCLILMTLGLPEDYYTGTKINDSDTFNFQITDDAETLWTTTMSQARSKFLERKRFNIEKRIMYLE
jgi:hypothetical protein